jgi:hypothetical protein
MSAARGWSRAGDGDVVIKMSPEDFDLLLHYLGRAAETLTERELEEALRHMNRLKGDMPDFKRFSENR